MEFKIICGIRGECRALGYCLEGRFDLQIYGLGPETIVGGGQGLRRNLEVCSRKVNW